MASALVELGLDGEGDFGVDVEDDPFGGEPMQEEKNKPKVVIVEPRN